MRSAIANGAAAVLNGPIGAIDSAVIARGLTLLLLFMLAAGNAYWYVWNSLYPSLLLAPMIWLCASASERSGPVLRRDVLWTAMGFGALFLVATVSLLVNQQAEDSALQWAGSYASPLLLLVALQAVPLDAHFARRCWLAITLGAAIPLLHGLASYYAEWGVPTGAELLFSRYSLERMEPYMRATYGNTGNTAAYLTLLLPMWLCLSVVGEALGRFRRLLFRLAVLVALAHVAIVQSRTLLLVLIVIVPCVLFFLRIRAVWAVGGLLVIGAIVLLPILSAWDQFLELTAGALEGSESDSSVSERLEAMQYAARTLADNPAFGIGPGNTVLSNPHTAAHQYWLQQGSELGIWGLLAGVLLSLAVFGRFAVHLAARNRSQEALARFVFVVGPAAYMLYGCIANMPLSQNVVNSWVGLLAAMLGLAACRWVDSPNNQRVRRR